MSEDTSFDTMGYDDGSFAVVGYDEVGAPIYQPRAFALARPAAKAPSAQTRLFRAGTSPIARPNMLARAFPGGANMMPQAGLNEPRVRAIVREEMGSQLPHWFQNAAQVPGAGAPVDGELMSPLGLEAVGAGALTAAAPLVVFRANPQRPFRGERLIISLARTAGAANVGVGIDNFKIGENSQLVGSGLVPAEAFGPDSFGVRLAMSAAEPGIDIEITLTAVVPGGESITPQVAIIGRAVWGPRG